MTRILLLLFEFDAGEKHRGVTNRWMNECMNGRKEEKKDNENDKGFTFTLSIFCLPEMEIQSTLDGWERKIPINEIEDGK